MSKMIPVAAGIVAIALVSGFVDVNIDHHLNLPPELTNKNTSTVHHSLFRRTIDIRLASTIGKEESVRDVVKILQEATVADTIRFHIAGYGGQVDTVFLLINNVRASKAKVIMIVEAPSYSGHAYLAVAGNETIMMPYSFLMFHTSSAYGTNCDTQQGVDRTVPNSEHCAIHLKFHLMEVEKYIDQISILTDSEKAAIKTGHDVYITSEEFNKRTGIN